MVVFTVSDFLAHINDSLQKSWDPVDLCVEGEVSGFRVSQGQWVNFDLKDENGLVNIFMTVWQLKVPVEDGMRVQVYGSPRIYPKFGKFSLSAQRVELVGEGALKKALALLRARLEQEGLFDPSRKRSLPTYPQRIALVASRESAAYGDFLRVLGERWGGLDIDVYHVQVQGASAVQDMVSAIQQANGRAEDYDVLVLTRGGGSLEDLMAFNDEQLVRAVHASKIPTLVGIGHERDVSLAEETADVRGSTPTDCARRLVPDRQDTLRQLSYQTDTIERSLQDYFHARKELLDRALRVPLQWIRGQRERLDYSDTWCQTHLRQWLSVLTDRFRAQERLLASLDPVAVLARGYAIVRGSDHRPLTSASELTPKTDIRIQFRDGNASAHVISRTVARVTEQQSFFKE